MKALIYNGPWEMELAELPTPEAGEGEVLLQVEAVGICGSDVHGFTGESGRRKPGMVMGHEIAGRILEVPDNQASLKVGDRVTVYNIRSCGTCEHCRAGNTQRCASRSVIGVNAGTWGAMAEFLACSVDQCVPLAPGLDPAAALLAEPVAVGLHAIKLMEPGPDDVLAVIGSGTIGLGLVMALKAKGMKNVFALDVLEEKLGLAESMGANPIHVGAGDAGEEIRRATGGGTAAGTFEAVGTSETVRAAFDLLGPGGTLVVIGNLDKEFTLPLQGLTDKEITVCGSYGFSRSNFAEAVELINQAAVPVERLISGRCTLEETPGVMTQLAKGEIEATKIVIEL